MGTSRIIRRISQLGGQYRRDRRGGAGAEFALMLTVLVFPVLNVVDIGFYIYSRMELENATQVAAQAAWATCSAAANLPATPNSYAKCPVLPNAVATAAHSTSLGSGITVTITSEDYKCVSSSTSALVSTGTFPTPPPNKCNSYGGSANDTPGDYIQVTGSFAYSPFFPAASVASLLTTPITHSAWTRLN